MRFWTILTWKFQPWITAGVLLTGRTVAVVGTITLSTSMAASAGPIQMAGHQICMQIWLAVSLLNDALALAGQVNGKNNETMKQ